VQSSGAIFVVRRDFPTGAPAQRRRSDRVHEIFADLPLEFASPSGNTADFEFSKNAGDSLRWRQYYDGAR